MPSRFRLFVFVLAALTVTAADRAGAVSPETWRVTGVDGWSGTQRDSVGVTNEGSIGLSLASIRVEGLDATTVWDLLPDGDGVLAATGDGGMLYRIDASGKASEVAHVLQPEITSLGRDGKGNVLLGTSPDGVVYRLEGGRAVPLADTPETYIWRILPLSGEGALVAAGDAGKIYRIRGRNEVELFADLGAAHVTGLEAVADGYLATTESPGAWCASIGMGRAPCSTRPMSPSFARPWSARTGRCISWPTPPTPREQESFTGETPPEAWRRCGPPSPASPTGWGRVRTGACG